jgi:hypothetical protein
MSRLTLPQIELIAAACKRRLFHNNDSDYTTGTHSDVNVTRSVSALHRRGLLVRGEEEVHGWLWAPTQTARQEAIDEIDELRDRITWLRRDLAGDTDG